jgi:alpha-glucosidase
MAMFVVYESPLQLFAGNISDALREPELMELVGKIPSVWDETIILEAQLGRYIVEARRSGKDWYLAAINSWSPADFTISLSFLKEGVHSIESASDGINAARNPHDYTITKMTVISSDNVKIKLAPGGGFVARISPN